MAAATVVIAFVAFGAHDGVPILRHDWGLPLTGQGWKTFATSLASGWDANGIGNPRPYPTLFLLGPLLSLVALAFGSNAALVGFLIAIGVAYVWAGVRMATQVGARPEIGLALGASLLFSPWTFEKLVAGHLTMLLSAGACALLIAELLSTKPRRWAVVTLAYIAAFQIQYGILVIIVALVIRAGGRTFALVCAGSILSLLPSIVGILRSGPTLAGIPVTAAWQHVNSVPLGKALLLDGYSMQYTHASASVFQVSIFALLIASLFGVAQAVTVTSSNHRARVVRLTLASCILVLYASGYSGPLARLYGLSLEFRPFLVFRELFDILGVVALFYGLLAVLGAARSRIACVLIVVSAATAFVAWSVAPPWRWWVPGHLYHPPVVDTSKSNSRFALVPWRQPLRLDGVGSGADPDDYARANNVVPINEYSESYPEVAALAEYDSSGDPSSLEALSVAKVYSRRRLSTDIKSLRVAVPLEAPTSARRGMSGDSVRALKPQPELSVVSMPPDRATIGHIRDLYLFEGGHEEQTNRYVAPVSTSRTVADPRQAWIDATLVFGDFPEAANPFGGAFTVNQNALLPIPRWQPRRALVRVSGTLLSNRGQVSASTPGWVWVSLNGAASLRCKGACTVAAWERRTYLVEQENVLREPKYSTPLGFREITPFLVVGRLPRFQLATARPMLLYRTRYNPSWLLWGIPRAEHLEVSLTFNGYALPRTSKFRYFALIEVTAALQTLAMILSLLGLGLVVWPWRSKAEQWS